MWKSIFSRFYSDLGLQCHQKNRRIYLKNRLRQKAKEKVGGSRKNMVEVAETCFRLYFTHQHNCTLILKWKCFGGLSPNGCTHTLSHTASPETVYTLKHDHTHANTPTHNSSPYPDAVNCVYQEVQSHCLMCLTSRIVLFEHFPSPPVTLDFALAKQNCLCLQYIFISESGVLFSLW